MQKSYDYKISASGRINIIGEHIDYCGGKVLPASISLKNTIYLKANGTDKINISFTTLPDKVTLDVNKLDEYTSLKYGNYQAGCACVWKNAGHKVLGCDMLYDCTVPFGSGLSSSAAIEVSTLVALATVANEKTDKKEIALLSQKAEREYAKVNCGIMDQYASANGKKDNAILLDCKKVEHTYIPCDLKEYTFVVTNCNKPHSLADSKYNEIRKQTEDALSILKQHININCLAELSVAQFENLKDKLPTDLQDRVCHIVHECDRVNSAVTAMSTGNLIKLGELLNESHKSLKELYKVSCVELDTLTEYAQKFNGCLGSRMMGGGFGGCTLSLVKKDEVNEFKKYVGENYVKIIGYAPTFYDTYIDDGITVEKL